MKRLILFSFIFLSSIAFCDELNYSYNETLVNDSIIKPWYSNYADKFLSSDNSGLIAVIIGLSLGYFIGKFAFKFIKLAIILLLIALLLRIIF
ncbi:MAG: hypothetical protein WC376_01245 [Candidatus Nanoarchaeia archaeon]|jgi:hypothetical protein